MVLQHGESKVGKMRMVKKNPSLKGLILYNTEIGLWVRMEENHSFPFKERTSLCLQDRAGSQFVSHRSKLKYWGSVEQTVRLCGTRRCWHREVTTITTATSPLLPSFLPGPTSKVSLLFVAYYSSPEADLFSHPLVQPMTPLSHNRTMISPFWGACFAAHYRQFSALFFPKASPPTKSIPTKKCKYEEETTHLLILQIWLGFPSSMSSLKMFSFPEYT